MSKSNPTNKNRIYKFNIGDIVRISKLRMAFNRYYNEHWTNEAFIVVSRDFKQNIAAYELSDYDGETILGIFYEEELQKIYINENTTYNIEKVIRSRTKNKQKESLVKWMGWPDKFNSWIPAVDIKKYK